MSFLIIILNTILKKYIYHTLLIQDFQGLSFHPLSLHADEQQITLELTGLNM